MDIEQPRFTCQLCRRRRIGQPRTTELFSEPICIYCVSDLEARNKPPVRELPRLSSAEKRQTGNIRKLAEKWSRQGRRCADCKSAVRRVRIVGKNRIRRLVCCRCYYATRRRRPAVWSWTDIVRANLIFPAEYTP